MAFLGILKELRRRFGSERVQAALRGWGDEIARVSGDRIRRSDWYPYTAFGQLLMGAEQEFGDGKGDLCKALGAAAAKSDLSGAFSVLKLLASPRHLIGSCERVWPRYYKDAGRMEAVATRPDRTVLRIHGFPSMVPAHCRMMEGWMIQAMAVLGAKVLPGACESTCVSRGGPYHEFVCTWTT